MRAFDFGLRRRICALAVALVAALCCCSLCVGSVQQAWADDAVDLGAPAHSKTLTANGDGTYTLTLDVTGKSQASQEKTKANVIVVVDTSGSMDTKTGSFVYREATSDDSGGHRYGLVGDNYKELKYRNGSWYYESGNGLKLYSGTVYVREEGEATRLDAAKSAVKGLAEELLELNGEGEDTIQMALVTFSNIAQVQTFSDNGWTTSYSAFSSCINGLRADGGTNWEDALAKANAITCDNDPTYVIFVSDGNPTFRDTKGDYSSFENDWNSDYNKTYGVWGSGHESDDVTVQRCYDNAKDDAFAIVSAGKSFYAIGAFGDVDRMRSLLAYAYEDNAPANHYFSAVDHEGLESAFASIVDDIEKNYTYTDVVITDKVTDLTATGIVGEATDFTYKKDGEVWLDAPAASFANGVVTWNLGDDFKLEDGVTYSVSFKVWPNQDAFDAVAALTDGTLKWDYDKYPNIRENEDGMYSVYTNESATLFYKQVDTVDGEDTKGETKTSLYERPTMPVPISALTIEKVWNDDLNNADRPTSITLDIMKDGSSYMSVQLSEESSWKKQVYLAPGLVAAGEVLEKGHVYSVVEPSIDVHYELEDTSFSPMMVDGSLVASYDPTATSNSGTTVAVKNVLKGNLSIEKTVSAASGLTPNPDTEFTAEVSFSRDKSSWVPDEDDGVTYAKTSGGVIVSSGNFPEDGTFTLKNGESVTISNLPSGVSYKVSEKDLPGGFSLNKEVSTGLDGTIEGNKASKASLVNVYSVSSVTAAIPVKKVLSAAEGLTPPDITGKYTFALTAVNDEPLPDTTTLSNPGSSGGIVTFGGITFTAPGVYCYKVTETGEVSGVANDTTASKDVTVVVSDKGDGALSAAVSSTAEAPLTFTNTYSVSSTKATITAKKVLENAALAAGAFSFELSAVNGAPMPTSSIGTNDADGTVAFGEITYSMPGSYTYTIAEAAGSATYFDYDSSTKTVTVLVEDNSDGTMTATVSGDGADATFTNIYKASSNEVFISAVKNVNGDPAGDDIFEFTLTSDDEAPLPERIVVTNNGGSVTFGPIKYDASIFGDEVATVDVKDGIERSRTFTYTISEEKGSAAGYTYDAHSEKVTVTVTDKGDGKLETEVSYDQDGAIFENTYTAKGAAVIEAVKTLSGADLGAGQFEFGLFEGDTRVATATNDADGAISFAVEYDQEDVGTHVYAMRELGFAPTGYTYDSTSKMVSVKVSDNGNGTLGTEVSYGGDMTFSNSYKPLPTDVVLEAQKTLSGRDLVAGEFSFKVEDEGGAIVSTGTNDASGMIAFSAIPLTEEGVYTFTAYEEKGSAEGVTYDDSSFVYKVTVVDKNGQLQVGGIEVEEDVVFSNTYAPTDPAPTVLSRTGDSGIAAGIAVVAAAAALAALLSAKRARERY